MGERSTPLLEEHRRLGARLVDFAGWEMPLQYQGVIAEHNAVRTSCGVFDVSHLGKLRVRGRAGGEALQQAVTADVSALAVGRASYALALDDDGGTLDDVFVYRIAADEWVVVPNAANVSAVADSIRASGGDPVDEWDRWAILAVQGPEAYGVLERALPGSGAADLKLHRFVTVDVEGEPGLIARTGYTGEKGVEVYAPAEGAPALFRRLLEAGAVPAGLGARDTLRLEMGYALYGHELAEDINPLEAGLGWAVKWDAPFRGREALERVRSEGPARTTFGIRCTTRGVPRQSYEVRRDGEVLGTLTSGNFSPTLGTGIAIAIGPVGLAPEEGETVTIDARGRDLPGVIVTPPFIPRRG